MTFATILPSLKNTPAISRVYDYLLGGKHNYDVDRQASQAMIDAVSETPKEVLSQTSEFGLTLLNVPDSGWAARIRRPRRMCCRVLDRTSTRNSGPMRSQRSASRSNSVSPRLRSRR